MVKVGFICEGHTEAILLQSEMFKNLLAEFNLIPVNVVNAEGCGNLLPHNIAGYIQSLENMGAKAIIILTDLDLDVCITQTKQRISARPQDLVIVAVKQIESWFLASNTAMRGILNVPNFNFDFPENEITPFNAVNNLLVQHTGRGIGKVSTGGKTRLAKRLLANDFDLRETALHSNCSSARYFLQKLRDVGLRR